MGKNLKSDFVTQDIVEFEIEGRKFKYKPVTAGQENDWLSEYMVMKNGVMQQDLTKLNKLKMRNLVTVPYGPGLIKEILDLKEATDWENLDWKERWRLISQLKPNIFSDIVVAINNIDKVEEKKT